MDSDCNRCSLAFFKDVCFICKPWTHMVLLIGVNFFLMDDKSEIRGHTDWSPAIQTRNVTDYNSADVVYAGRAGGMVVITILVSIGGLVLVIALIVAVALSNKK
ncbi:UNVERIFIED_CONTAM: hypothetical protein K2H54_019968 [Gekko kuhli]